MSKPKRITVSFTMTPEIKAVLERIADADHRNMSSQIEWLIKEDLRKRGPSFAKTIGVDYATAEPLPEPDKPKMTIEQEIAVYLGIAGEKNNFWAMVLEWADQNGYHDTRLNEHDRVWVRLASNALGTTPDMLDAKVSDTPRMIRYLRSKAAANFLDALRKPTTQETAQ